MHAGCNVIAYVGYHVSLTDPSATRGTVFVLVDSLKHDRI